MRIRLKVQNGNDRERIVIALANSGYRVKVIKSQDPNRILSRNYYVDFDVEDNAVTE